MLAAVLEELEQRHGLRAEGGLQVLAPSALATCAFDPGWPLLVLPEPTGGAGLVPSAGEPSGGPDFAPDVLPGRAARPAEPLALLRALYPPEHPVRGLAGAPDTTVGELTTEALAAGVHLLPALVGETNLASPHALPWIAARLRAPDGCPWDRRQTHTSLRKHLLEEAYEVYDALEGGSTPELAEELGDLLLQVVLHAQYGAEAGVFDLADVYRAVNAKIVRRHPHVFGEVEASTVDQVLRNWEAIKAAERAARAAQGGPAKPAAPGMPEAFAGLSRSLPALAYAQEMSERAASLGYDWPDVEGVLDKLEEEAVELMGAAEAEARQEEFGDLLFVVVNLGRKLGVDAEAALRAASGKFAARFAIVERLAAERGQALERLSFEALDELWMAAKREARGAADEEAPA